jgi:hypothetical protein
MLNVCVCNIYKVSVSPGSQAQYSRSCPIINFQTFKVEVKVTLRLTVRQSASLGVEPHVGFITRCLLLSGSYGLVSMGRPLWLQNRSAFVYAAGSCQYSLSRGWVPWDSRLYFTASDLRHPFLSSLTTRSVTVEVLDPSSTRVSAWVLQDNFSARTTHSQTFRVRVRVTLRLMVGQSLCLGVEPPILVTVCQLVFCPWEGALCDERTDLSFTRLPVSSNKTLCRCVQFTFYLLLNVFIYNIYKVSASPG